MIVEVNEKCVICLDRASFSVSHLQAFVPAARPAT